MPAELHTLALYADENGEPQQCIIIHSLEVNPINVDLSPVLPNFNEGCTLVLIDIDDMDFDFEAGDRPDVTDGYGQEVPCHYIDIREASRA